MSIFNGHWKNCLGNIFTVMHAFLQTTKAWTFRWLFIVVFPAFLSKRMLQCIRIVISDGDSSEYGQIDAAMKEVMPNATRLRCGWHIVNRGWKRHCSNAMYRSMCPLEKRKYHKTISIIKEWLYSWMRPGYCNNMVEYQVSKYLLYEYICLVKDILGERNVETIHKFIIEYVELHKTNFSF